MFQDEFIKNLHLSYICEILEFTLILCFGRGV